ILYTRQHNAPTKWVFISSQSYRSFPPYDHNWKGIAISLLVILVVLSLLDCPSFCSPEGHVVPLTLDDLFDPNFQIHDPDAKWINGKLLSFNITYTCAYISHFLMLTFITSPKTLNVCAHTHIRHTVSPVYQKSFLASYLIYNLFTREVRELNPPEVSDSVLQFASWGVQGQQLIYVFENNIYYQTDVQSSSWRLTSSGQDGIIFNGIGDWLYEVEVLKSPVAHWWSPDGSKLAYLTINDTQVPNMLLPRFTGALYPKGEEYPYPKMGQPNPTVSLNVVTLDGSSRTTELGPPESFLKSDFYVSMVKWTGSARVAVRWVNRAQNMSILSLCEASTGTCTKKHVATTEKWLDRQNEEPMFSKDYTTFYVTMPIKHGGRGTFSHITKISNQVNFNIRHLTSGSWEVTDIVAFDENSNALYYLSTENGAMQRHLYRVSTVDPYNRECLTCSLFKPQCSFYRVVLSPDYQHVLLHCTGNKSNFNCGDEAFTSYLSSDSTPGGQAVSEQFSLDWDSVLVSSDSVIVARLDARGSGFEGQRLLHELHHRLGILELQDHITAVQYLTRLPYIDGSRVGVYGKAYGGFLSSVMLLSYSHIFKCSVAVAPITNWRLYGKNKCLLIEKHKDKMYYTTVHFQHSAELVKLLSSLNANYTLQIFPDEGHNIASVNSRHYMLSSVIGFFRHCFVADPVVAPDASKEDD
uniref:Uncharacterized protein n=1 Tax=Neogobius melanostomus TaxID=47308 RepID=A0A8C6UC94_9GOBI